MTVMDWALVWGVGAVLVGLLLEAARQMVPPEEAERSVRAEHVRTVVRALLWPFVLVLTLIVFVLRRLGVEI